MALTAGSTPTPTANHLGMKRVDTWLRTHRFGAAGCAVGSVAVFVAGALAYSHWAGNATNIVSVELAGSPSVVAGYVTGRESVYGHALWVDYGFIAAYGIAVLIGCALGRALSSTAMARRVSTVAMGATVGAVLCDVGENETLRPLVRTHGAGQSTLAVAAQAFSVTKWALILPAVVVAVVAVITTLWRATRRPEQRPDTGLVARPATDNDESVTGAGAVHSAWRANTKLPVGRDYGRGEIGICVSGGGIRSATFALGALDALRAPLRRARYLVSVSGGGFAAGAMQLALQPVNPPDTDPGAAYSAATPADVYTTGSSELDHTRKHGKYLADGGAEWTAALGRILRGVAVNLLTLGLVLVVVGRLLGHLYASFPQDLLRTGTWPPPAGASWAVGVTFGLGLLVWMVGVWTEPNPPAVQRALDRFGMGAAGLGAFLAVTLIGLPLLAWAARTPPHGTVVVTGQITSLLGGYAAALVAVGKRPAVRKGIGKVRDLWTNGSAKQRSLAANVTVALGLIAVVGGLLLLLGMTLATTGPVSARSQWPGHLTEWKLTLCFGAATAFFATVDQVRWSLHPYYKRRLATAFSVRRIRRGGRINAKAYGFDIEQTSLAAYGQRHLDADGKPDFPQVIFSCSAHTSSQLITPPGRHVVPWTMSGDHVGSPMIGWAKSNELEALTPPLLRRDLTIQAAQAISGAAISSQMGRMDHVYARVLTLTNVRLGSWLPNPAFLDHRANAPASELWCIPTLPRRRYLATLGRELVGSYPTDGPLVFVTDGGHYENLGLVELLRHRCSTVYCLDASGDHPDVAATLAAAIELAYEELGVVIELDRPGALGAGAGAPHATAPDTLLSDLENRLAQSCVVTGRITYPDLGPDLPEEHGLFVLGKAVLTSRTPFDVLAHASRNPSFPNDSTADQWFDFTQFDAYHALGRFVGDRVVDAMEEISQPATQAEPVVPPQPRREVIDLTPGPAAEDIVLRLHVEGYSEADRDR
jgi:hypothetical protein